MTSELINYSKKMPKKYRENFDYYNPNPDMIQHPFQVSIVGRTGCGKSTLLINMINQCKCFTKIIIYCKLTEEAMYRYLQDELGDDNVIITNDINDLPSLKDVKNYDEDEEKSPLVSWINDNEQILVVFDDCMTKKKQDKIVEYFSIGRKCNISSIYISQSYFKIPPVIRANCRYFFIRGINSKLTLRKILSDKTIIHIDLLYKIYKDATEEKGSFFKIDCDTEPNKMFGRNFIKNYQVEQDD